MAKSVGIGTTGTVVAGTPTAGSVTVAVVARSGWRGNVVSGVEGEGVELPMITTFPIGAGDTGLSVGAKEGMGPGVGIAVGGG